MQQRNDQDRRYYLSTADFAAYQGESLSSVKRRIRKGEIAVTKFASSNARRKGRLDNFIHYSALKKSAQDKFLLDRKIRPAAPEKNKGPEEGALKIWQKDEADKRAALVQEYKAMLASCPRKKKTEAKKAFAQIKGKSPKSLDRWLLDYEKFGFRGLIPKWAPGERRILIDDEVGQFVEKKYLISFGPPLTAVYEAMIAKFGPVREHLPSYRTVARWVNTKWTKSQQTLLRNPEQWNKKFSPFIRRDWAKVPVNGLWIADHKQIDNFCLWRGKPICPWFSAFKDARSRRIVGYVMVPVPNSSAIGQALVNAVSVVGTPETLLVDCGKDYKSVAIAGEKIATNTIKPFADFDKTPIPGLFRELGIEVIFAAPYNAREKGQIESFFKIFRRFSSLPGWRSSNTATRPKKLAREIKNGNLLTFEELSTKVDELIQAYNARKHPATGKTPNSFYENFTPQIPSRDVLSFLLMDAALAKVRDSAVVIQGNVYRHEQLWRISGETVMVKRDPADIRTAAIIFRDQLFGFANLEVPGHFRGPLTLEAVQDTRRIRKRITKFRKEVLKHEDVIDDPLTYALDLQDSGQLRARDVRPAPEKKVVQLHQRQRLAGDVARGLKKVKETPREGPQDDEPQEDMLSKLLRMRTAQAPEETPKFSLVKHLTMFDHDDLE